jgi:hypothetical protein
MLVAKVAINVTDSAQVLNMPWQLDPSQPGSEVQSWSQLVSRPQADFMTRSHQGYLLGPVTVVVKCQCLGNFNLLQCVALVTVMVFLPVQIQRIKFPTTN